MSDAQPSPVKPAPSAKDIAKMAADKAFKGGLAGGLAMVAQGESVFLERSRPFGAFVELIVIVPLGWHACLELWSLNTGRACWDTAEMQP